MSGKSGGKGGKGGKAVSAKNKKSPQSKSSRAGLQVKLNRYFNKSLKKISFQWAESIEF